jgi:hypothetical protein
VAMREKANLRIRFSGTTKGASEVLRQRRTGCRASGITCE